VINLAEKQKKKKDERTIFDEKIKCPYCSETMKVTVTEKILTPSTPAEKERSVKAEKL
jgi:C4-type Zn-finger protein